MSPGVLRMWIATIQATEFGIDRCAEHATTNDTAIDIVFDRDGADQLTRHHPRRIDQHSAASVGNRLWCVGEPGPDRHQHQPILAPIPTEIILG